MTFLPPFYNIILGLQECKKDRQKIKEKTNRRKETKKTHKNAPRRMKNIMCTKNILYIPVLSGAISFVLQLMAINFKRKLT